MLFCYVSLNGLRKLILGSWGALLTNSCFLPFELSYHAPLGSNNSFPVYNCTLDFNKKRLCPSGTRVRRDVCYYLRADICARRQSWKSFLFSVQSPPKRHPVHGFREVNALHYSHFKQTSHQAAPGSLKHKGSQLFHFFHNLLVVHLLMSIFKTWKC